MEGDQWPPPLTPMTNQQDSSSSYLYNTNTSSIPISSSINHNSLLHGGSELTKQVMCDPEIDWVNLLTQDAAGCSTSSSTAAYSNRLLPPCSSSSRLVGGSEGHHDNDQGKNNNSLDDVRKVGRKVKKVVPPRVAFHTRSQDDILDDGYKWRKYGQKAVKNCNYPRSYYHCTRHTCNVKKQIQRLSKDPGIVVTTYEGIHNHPCEQFMETLTPLLNQIQFLTKF